MPARAIRQTMRMMFETIVWATDGSELADSALEHVVALARAHDSTIVAVHASEVMPGRYGGAPLYGGESEIREKIARQIEELQGAGYEAELELRSGSHDVATLISRAADDVGADLIVVATHGHGGLAAALMGSVARGLCHHANTPVLVVPPKRRIASE
jgi:nucleotide-binding universal stress UspA family protein